MPAKNIYLYEIYTKKHPYGDRGWDIQVGYVVGAPDRKNALRVVRKVYGMLFDKAISVDQVTAVKPLHADHYIVIPYNSPSRRTIHEGV